MGYGRAGWYSYDQLDMKGRSADRILPEHQQLAVGDLLPTDPGGGFVVKVLEPGRALVAFVDSAMVAARRTVAPAVPIAEAPGLAASGRFLATATPPEFAASWAFVLEPADGGSTRLIERFRVSFDAQTRGSRLLGPALGFGVFVMLQRQMVGIARRAEAHAREGMAAAGEGVQSPTTAPTADGSGSGDAGPVTGAFATLASS
jgi:hypothetical protein